MVSWIRDFSDTYHSRVGCYPVIYTTTDWWKTCTGNNAGFGSTSPLWIVRLGTSPDGLPAGWSYHTFWQYADHGSSPEGRDHFNGDACWFETVSHWFLRFWNYCLEFLTWVLLDSLAAS